MNTQLVKSEEKSVTYVPFGAADSIKLSASIIRNLIASPTKSGKTCDDRQAVKFLMLCQAQRLNPFAGDAYLIGYDGKDGPQFSLITAHQAFLKRAESSKDFDGMESGVIVRNREDATLKEFEGDFYDDTIYELVGAWARVHHKQHKIPTLRRGALKTYKKPFGLWNDPGAVPMMVVKCVEADALRSTFPTLLGGLYAEGETITIDAEPASQRASRLVATAPAQIDAPNGEQQPAANEPEKKADPTPAKATPQTELAKIVSESGSAFDAFQRHIASEYPAMDAGSWSGFEDISNASAKVLLRAQDGIVEALKGAAA